jgi:glucose-6-phosphate 1-dehydrogenase
MQEMQPTILVIVGISGDLAQRKLLPAIRQIMQAGVLPERFRVVGVSRRALDPAELTANAPEIRPLFEAFQMDMTTQADYNALHERLREIEKTFGVPAQRLFYLSVPPQVSQSIIELLGGAGLNDKQSKLLLEKPFGVDLSSAEALITGVNKYFDEGQVYRIDHYLAKEMVQNIVVLRQCNALFRRTWNKDFIERIEIIASEAIGIEGRATFYEQTGALRDLVQSHLLQLAAVTLMDLPPAEDLAAIPAKRLAALGKLHLPAGQPVAKAARRGQYQGYQTEVKNPGSTVETFVSLELASDDPTWHGVPIVLTTGKALDRKATEVRLHYREAGGESNQLILRIQPDEGASIDVWTKEPGFDRGRKRHTLHFAYGEHYTSLPEAYERVLVDAMRSDHSLFTSGDEVLASWRILAPAQAAWSMVTDDMIVYPKGSSPRQVLP